MDVSDHVPTMLSDRMAWYAILGYRCFLGGRPLARRSCPQRAFEHLELGFKETEDR